MNVIRSKVGRTWLAATPADAHLDRPERRWLDQQRLQAELDAADGDRRRLAGPGSKINAAGRRWTNATTGVAAAIVNATVDLPPQPPARAGRNGTDISNPTDRAVTTVHDTIAHTCITLAHLIARCPNPACPICDDRRGARRRDTLTDLHDTLGIDPDPVTHDDDLPVTITDIVDGLLGTPPTSTASLATTVKLTAEACGALAKTLTDGWHTLRRAGADADLLTKVADRAAEIANRAAGLEASVAQWLPSRLRLCESDGCETPTQTGEKTCGRCRTQKWRDKAS